MSRNQASRALVLVALSLAAVADAQAEIGALDPVPAATVLLPHFEVDLDDPQGVTTRLTLMNAGEGPVILQLTLWTDLAVPTMNWSAYLTGFDLMTLDLGALFRNGVLPATSHSDTGVSPVGDFSLTTHETTGVGPGSTSCNGFLPLTQLPAVFLAHIRAAHTGNASALFGGSCSGVDHGDNIARGYLTVDNASVCTALLPSQGGYFIDGGNGDASNENQLLGDFAVVNPATGLAFGATAVHLEASSTDPRTQPGEYTFYARYSGGADNREPLGTTFWARYSTGAAGEAGSLIYWRDSKRTISTFGCAVPFPAPYPLGQTQAVAFDAQENPDVLASAPSSPAPAGPVLLPFSFASGSVAVGGADLPVAAASGWLYLNLNSAVAGSQVPHEPILQSWIGVQFAGPQYSYGFDAFQVDNASAPVDALLPNCNGAPDPVACSLVPIFEDGFESGGLSAWSVVTP